MGDDCDNQNDVPPTFEQALERLETIVRELEDGQIGLAESLARYEDGVKLLKQCSALLRRAERKIELLSGIDANGNPVTEPFEGEQFDALQDRPLQERGQARARRRSAASKNSTRPDDRADIDAGAGAGGSADAGDLDSSEIDEPPHLF